MYTRTTIACSLLLWAACGPGPDGTTDTTATSGATTTTATTGTTTPTTGATGETSTGTTGATGETSTGDMTGMTGTTDATGMTGTTGAAACEAIVGSQDCAALVAVSGDLTLETCMKCQGSACATDPECDIFPCIANAIVIQGCCADAQCAGLSPFCGMFIAPNNVCVLSDDI